MTTTTASKIDFKTHYKDLYSAPSKDFVEIDVPPLQYLMYDGHGDPNTAPEYQQAVEALFSLAYTLKFMSKAAFGRDYTVAPLEGLWWASDMNAFIRREKRRWSWTMMILQPDWISQEHLKAAMAEVLMKKGLPGLEKARLESFDEGHSVQILHVGSYDNEGPVINRMRTEYLPLHGLTENGKHHEIYLSDPRRIAPDNLRTIIRQPVRAA